MADYMTMTPPLPNRKSWLKRQFRKGTTLALTGLMLAQSLVPSRVMAEGGANTTPGSTKNKQMTIAARAEAMRTEVAEDVSRTYYGEDYVVGQDSVLDSGIKNGESYTAILNAFKKVKGDALSDSAAYEKVSKNDGHVSNDFLNAGLLTIKDDFMIDTLASLKLRSPFADQTLDQLTINSGFGIRPELFGRTNHQGVDLKAFAGETIYNPVVGGAKFIRSYSGRQKINIVELDAGHGFVIKLMHDKADKQFKSGMFINEGQKLARVKAKQKGEESTGTHLHFQVEKDGKPINIEQIIYNDGEYAETRMMFNGQEIPQEVAARILKTKDIAQFNQIEDGLRHENGEKKVTKSVLYRAASFIARNFEHKDVNKHATRGLPSEWGVDKASHPKANVGHLGFKGAMPILMGEARPLLGKKMTYAMALVAVNDYINFGQKKSITKMIANAVDADDLMDKTEAAYKHARQYRHNKTNWDKRIASLRDEVDRLQEADNPIHDAKYQSELAAFRFVKQELQKRSFASFAEQRNDAKQALADDANEFDRVVLLSHMGEEVKPVSKIAEYTASVENKVEQYRQTSQSVTQPRNNVSSTMSGVKFNYVMAA